MKKNFAGISFLMKASGLLLMFLILSVSCQMLGENDVSSGTGELRISFEDGVVCETRVGPDIPDTSDFLLTVTGADGDIIYDGVYGASPESMLVDAGSYTIYVRSCEFVKPSFSMPQFGDEQCVIVSSGDVADVKLTCRQMNCGIHLDIDESFLTSCPDGSLHLKSSDGRLMYGYSEKRTAYFLPGNVSLMLSEGGNDKVLMTRLLKARDMLRINVSAPVSSSSEVGSEKISVAVDTVRNWLTEDYVIGGTSGRGNDLSSAMTVVQAMASAGEEDVWVCGYVVGGDLTSASASFEAPFSSRTNILLGSRSSASDRSSCLAVQLPSGDVRDALNLVDNPSMLGRKIYVRGDLVESYYGLPGIKNVTDYEE